MKAGQFRVDWIDATGRIKAGCHVLDFEECKRLAMEIGVSERLPETA